jgi:hypothetical protein
MHAPKKCPMQTLVLLLVVMLRGRTDPCRVIAVNTNSINGAAQSLT